MSDGDDEVAAAGTVMGWLVVSATAFLACLSMLCTVHTVAIHLLLCVVLLAKPDYVTFG